MHVPGARDPKEGSGRFGYREMTYSMTRIHSQRTRGRTARGTALRLALAVLAVWGLSACAKEPPPNAEFVPVLVYHQIVTDSTPPGVTVTPLEAFEEHMAYLAENGYHTATGSELVKYMREEITLPPRTVVLAFDDAWKSTLNAIPVLERHGMKAIFLVPTGPVDWEYPGYMSWEELEKLAENPKFEFGGHSVSHPWRVGDNLITWNKSENAGRSSLDVIYELEVPRQELHRHLDRPIRIFAWPSGWYDDALISLAEKAGYEGLFTMDQKTNSPGDSPLRIGRYPVWGQFGIEELQQLLAGEVRNSASELLPGGDTLVNQSPDAHY